MRRMPHALLEIVEEEVKSLLQAGIIRPAFSEWAFPIVPVMKKYGSMRVCVDFRELNKILKRDEYPLPRIDELLDSIGIIRPKLFCTLNCMKGFHQMKIHPDSVCKMAFRCHLGMFEYT